MGLAVGAVGFMPAGISHPTSIKPPAHQSQLTFLAALATNSKPIPVKQRAVACEDEGLVKLSIGTDEIDFADWINVLVLCV